jgi:hypothetical protein
MFPMSREITIPPPGDTDLHSSIIRRFGNVKVRDVGQAHAIPEVVLAIWVKPPGHNWFGKCVDRSSRRDCPGQNLHAVEPMPLTESTAA